MKQLSVIFIFSLVLATSLSGCSNLNCTRLETLLGGDVNLVSLGKDIGDDLIDQSFPPLRPRQPEQPVLVTTLVSNDNLHKSSSFGRSLQNSIAAEFVRQGFTVKEVKLRRDVAVNFGEGEFMLSRDLGALRGTQRAQAVVVGTYTMANRMMYLSVRLVKAGDSSIRSVYEKRICLDANSLRMLGLEIDEDDGIDAPSGSWLDMILY